MTFFLALTLGLLFFFTYRKHTFILFYAPFSVMLQPWMCIRYSAPALTVSFAINFVLTIFLLLKRKHAAKNNPFSKVVVLMILGNLIGLLSSQDNIILSLPDFMQKVCAYTPLVLLYDEIRTEKDLKIILKFFVWVAITLLVYGFLEFILQKNPLLLYATSGISEKYIMGKIYYSEEGIIRFGSIRCQSLMTISIAWGALCAIFFGVVVSIKNYLKHFFNKSILHLIILLSIIGCLSAGSRSPYVFFVIIFLPFFLKNFSTKEKIFCLIIFFIALIYTMPTINSIVKSFSSQSDVSGSSPEMRIKQFETIIMAMKDNFIFGIGNKGVHYITSKYSNAYGAESIWFQTFITTGVCGVTLQILQYYQSFKTIVRNVNRTRGIEMRFFLLGWIAFSTLTTSPGLSYVYFLIIITIIMKCDIIRSTTLNQRGL